MLQINFGSVFSKWPKAIAYCSFSDENGKVARSFLPDVLYDYNPQSMKAILILDVKNKMKYFSNSDIYQISFYCWMLKSNFGILIYPYFTRLIPKNIRVKPLSGEGKLSITAIFFDLRKMLMDFSSSQDQFIGDVKQAISTVFS